MAKAALQKIDPRWYQIAVLTSLLIAGLSVFSLDITTSQIIVTFLTAFLVQAVSSYLAGIKRMEFKSAAISAISLCLLFRSNSLLLVALITFISITSKFLVRFNNKHIFNPTNLGLALATLFLPSVAWISPGQWGSEWVIASACALLGIYVVVCSSRLDVTIVFLLVFGGLLFKRALYLGDPLTIPLHQVMNGALVLFAFFMISDPKATPDSRLGRIVFAVTVAFVAYNIRFKLYDSSALMWALFFVSPLVPILDLIFPGSKFEWRRSAEGMFSTEGIKMKGITAALLLIVSALLLPVNEARAFCGFYVARADTKIYNKASKVALVRDGDRTVLTMANDFQGDLSEFAIVIPVPTALEKDQIHVANAALIDHLDAYTAPRLVEYFDSDPCNPIQMMARSLDKAMPQGAEQGKEARANSLGVKIEAEYTIGEYDIVILSAKESNGLETWLNESGYKIPSGASDVLGSYIKQNMHFFVAKVNLKEQKKLGFSFLRPIQVAYESPKFMLPIRLGTVNADGTQELFVFTLTKNGRVETTNYRTTKLPEGVEVPAYVKEEFSDFYKQMFNHQVEKEGMKSVFLEYAWDMGWCDPCAAEPLSNEELKELGVFWLGDDRPSIGKFLGVVPPSPQNVFVTRLHLRYDKEHYPEDLMFHETGDRTNFQGRFVLRHPWTGTASCEAADKYRSGLPARREAEVQNLADLTGWAPEEIRKKARLESPKDDAKNKNKWWKDIWGS